LFLTSIQLQVSLKHNIITLDKVIQRIRYNKTTAQKSMIKM